MVRRWLVAVSVLSFTVAAVDSRATADLPRRAPEGVVTATETPKAGDSVKPKLETKVPADAIEALENAESFVLFSLDPGPAPAEPKERVQDWPALGRVDLTADATVRKRLVSALWQGVVNSDGTVAGCFNPRHAIRVTYKGMTIDWVICFECFQVEITEGKRRGKFLTAGSPQPEFDKVLTDAGVPLPAKAKR